MRAPMSLLAIALSALPLLAAILLVIFLVRWVRERRTMKRAGVGPDSPGCGACLYLVRGWDSPHCPECGADVRQRGVVIGPRLPLTLKIATIAVLVPAVTLPLCVVMARWLFVQSSQVVMWQVASAAPPSYQVHLRTERVQNPPLQSPSFETVLIIDPAGTLAGMRIMRFSSGWAPPEPADGASNRAWRRLEIGPRDDAPAPQRLEGLIADAVGSDVTPLIRDQAAVLVRQIQASRDDQPFAAPFSPPPALFVDPSSGSGTASKIWAPARVGMFIVPAVLALLLVALVVRSHRRGWRPAVEGEWLLATDR